MDSRPYIHDSPYTSSGLSQKDMTNVATGYQISVQGRAKTPSEEEFTQRIQVYQEQGSDVLDVDSLNHTFVGERVDSLKQNASRSVAGSHTGELVNTEKSGLKSDYKVNLSLPDSQDTNFKSELFNLDDMDRMKLLHDNCAVISETEEMEDVNLISKESSYSNGYTGCSIVSSTERRKTCGLLENLPREFNVKRDNHDGSERMTMRRNSMMSFSRQRESRDSVESLESRKTSVASSRKCSYDRNSGPSLRRASFVVPQFLKRDNSVAESDFNRRTSHTPEVLESNKDQQGILNLMKDASARWKKVDVKLNIPIQEIRGESEAVRFTYLEDVQTALQDLLGTRDPVVILRSRKKTEVLTSSTDEKYGQGLRESEVDDSNSLDTGKRRLKEKMAPQNEISNNNGMRRLSISDVINTMKSQPDNYQRQIEACVDMARFADDDDIEVLIKKQEAISFIMTAMSKFMDKTELLLAACKTLVALSANSEASCVQMCRENGTTILLQVVHTHGDNTPLLIFVLEILGNISLTEELSEEIVSKAGHSEILAKMSCQRNDYNVARLCCFILGNLVNKVDVAQSIMFVGGVHCIIEALRIFPRNAEVLENGCRALGCFSAHDEICMDVVNAGAVEAVLVAMASAPEVDTLQECGCWALACLTKFEESCVNVCKVDGINTIATTLERFPNEEALQEYGCWILSNIAAHEQTLHHVVKHRVLRVVTDMIDHFPDNLEIQQQVFFAIGQIVMTSGEMQERLVKSGGVRSVVNIMTSFPDSPELQEHGCRILGNVAVNEQLRKLIETDGGSKAVVSAMLTHDRHEQIQTYGCMALTNITADVPENKNRVAANSGLSAVLAALTEMITNTDIILCGLKTLCNLIGGDDSSYYFIEEDGLEIMETVISRYSKRTDINNYVCRILANVPLAPGLAETYLDATLDVINTAIVRFPGYSDLRLSLCHFYENLVLTDGGRLKFYKGKHLDRLSDTMTVFKDDKAVQMSGCKIIAAISMDKGTSDQEGEFCARLVLDVMRIFHGCSSIQTVCCGAISYLVEHNDHLRDYILRKGGMEVMMENLREHPTDEGLAVVGLMALDSITHKGMSDSNRLQNEISYVSSMMTRYSDNMELQTYSCNILSAVGKEGIQWDGSRKSEALEPVTCLLKRRRSNSGLSATALEVLAMLLSGETEDTIRKTKDRLPFLDEEFWENCYRNDLHIDI
ncbi:uncharacterized protein [Argopecten irradians]|uniref:uncharacterized protein n=1 Tax=Argopecten irradians TaxID=31199 RepID=UPI00371D78DA